MDDDDARERGDGSIWTVQDFIAYIDRHTDAKVHKITGKGLTEVPADISRIKEHSVRLGLSYNLLTVLPQELGQFRALRYVNLKGNQFRVFPSVLCHIPTLELLDISKNKLTRLPDDFGVLTRNLKFFSVSKNRLRKIPLWVADMTSLYVLRAEHNPQLTFPPPDVINYQGQGETPEQRSHDWLKHIKVFLRQCKEEAQQNDSSSDSDPQEYPQKRHPATQGRMYHLSLSEQGASEDQSTPVGPSRLMAQAFSDRHYLNHRRGLSQDSNSSIDTGPVVHNCTETVEQYLKHTKLALTARQLVFTADPLADGPFMRLLETARNVLYSMYELYRACKLAVDALTDQSMSRVFNKILGVSNLAITRLVVVLERQELRLISLRSSRKSHLAKSSLGARSLPATHGDKHDVFGTEDAEHVKELARFTRTAIGSFKKLVSLVHLQLRPLLENADSRVARNMLYAVNQSIVELRLATLLLPTDNKEEPTETFDHPASYTQQTTNDSSSSFKLMPAPKRSGLSSRRPSSQRLDSSPSLHQRPRSADAVDASTRSAIEEATANVNRVIGLLNHDLQAWADVDLDERQSEGTASGVDSISGHPEESRFASTKRVKSEDSDHTVPGEESPPHQVIPDYSIADGPPALSDAGKMRPNIDHNLLMIVRDVRRHMDRVEGLSNALVASLRAINKLSSFDGHVDLDHPLAILVEDGNKFVKAVVEFSVTARQLSHRFQLNDQTIQELTSLARTTKCLAAVLASTESRTAFKQ